MTKGTRKKGNDRENEAEEVFHSMGFQTWRPRAVRRPFSKDICGVFDIIAWDGMEVYLVQVKSDRSDASKARKKILALKMPDWLITQVVLMRRPGQKHVFVRWQLYASGWKRIDDFIMIED